MLSRIRLFTSLSLATMLTAASFSLNAAEGSEGTASPATASQEAPQTDILKVSEAFGHFIGRNLNSPGIKFDLESIIKGMRDGAAGKPAPMSDKDYEEMMTVLQEKSFKALSETNLTAAKEFLAKNAKAEGIIEIQPGKLQYTILHEGTDPAVAPHATPKIHYTGKYIDGSVFGSSEDVNGPIAVPLDQTIPGFSEGIVGMKEGEKRRLFVHPDLGYGTSGHLPPNALLIFDIELVKADSHDQDAAEDEEDDDLPPLALANENDDNASSDNN
jgi:peptidylprolyl isomerase